MYFSLHLSMVRFFFKNLFSSYYRFIRSCKDSIQRAFVLFTLFPPMDASYKTSTTPTLTLVKHVYSSVVF